MDPTTPAWQTALSAAERAGVVVEPLEGADDAQIILRVVDVIWGGDVLGRDVIRAFQHAGSVLYGASSDDALVGFVVGFAGLREGLHLHSHTLAVVPEWQARGVGYALKLAQRAACLDVGIEEVRWTYDPVVARNARFNLVKLGAVATAFFPNFYGAMRDRLNLGDRSDRFEIRWWLSSERVDRALRGDLEPPPEGPLMLEAEGDAEAPTPRETGAPPEPGARVALPLDYHGVRTRDSDLGRRWRDCSARAFRSCFDRGLAATWMSRDAVYGFDRWEGGA